MTLVVILWHRTVNGFWESEPVTVRTHFTSGDVLRVYKQVAGGQLCYTGGIYQHAYYCRDVETGGAEYYDVCTARRMYELPYTEITDPQSVLQIVDTLQGKS